MKTEGVIVAAAEACTALGLDLATTLLEIEAGTRRFEDTPLLDATGEPVRAARLTALPPGASRARRMAALGVTALRPVLEQVQRAGIDRVGLFLGLPADLPATAVTRVLLALREGAAPVQLTLPKRGAHALGRASAFFALQEAMELIAAGGLEGALVGAIDCLCDSGSLAAASGRGELLGPTNIEGRLPGEGAAFVWLSSERGPVPRGLAPARVLGVATGHEPRHLAQPQPNLGAGLTVVLRSLRRHPRAGEVRVDRLLSCQTDQGYWSTELTWVYLRNAALCPEPFEPRRLPAALGDTGAASGAIALALAARAAVGMEPGRRTLVLGGSDTGERGAFVVTAGEPMAWPPRSTASPTPPGWPPTLGQSELAPSFVKGLHDEHLEELGILLELRGDILRDPWLGWVEAADVEERIAAHLRAWAHEAADPLVPPHAARETLGGDDSERAAGAALALSGCDEAEVLAEVAEALVGLEPAEHPRWLDALAWRGHASATAIACFGRLLEAPEPAHAELGLRVLDGWAVCDKSRALVWLDTLEPGSEVHDAALIHVAQWGDQPGAVVARLQGMSMRGPAVEAALWVGQRAPLLALRMRVQQGYPVEPELLRYLAALGEGSDAELIERWLGSHRDETALGAASRALGRIGLGRSIPVLLRWLGEVGSDEARAVPVAEALDQICGANLRETCMVAPDEGDAEAEEPDEEPAAPEEVERTCLDPARWAAWWAEHAPRFHPARGYRRGRPTGALALVHELLEPGLRTALRCAALLDLFVRTGLRPRLHPHWPVALQRSVLQGLLAQLEPQERSR